MNLIQRAEQVQNETKPRANTAKRVGSILLDLANNYKNIVIVNDKNNLPPSVDGIIYLSPNVTYIIASHVDLEGDRIVTSGVNNILGKSSETSSLTSTGLGVGVPLITSQWTLVLESITIKDVDTAIDIDGNFRLVALDWENVNFNNIPNIGLINTCDNFIYDTGAFLGAQGLRFTGSIGTVAINNSLTRGIGALGDIIKLEENCVITRRFRIIYSSIIAFSNTIGLSIHPNATLPVQGIILDTCNFAGGSTYISGISFQDNEALFVNNVGITNSREVSQYYMNGNVTATTVSEIGATYKVAGTTTSGTFTSKFTNTDNRATFTGNVSKIFKVVATLSVESGNNNIIGVYIAKNGTLLTDSEVYITTNAGGRAEACTVQSLVVLEINDYIEIFVENDSAVTDITVTDLNVIID